MKIPSGATPALQNLSLLQGKWEIEGWFRSDAYTRITGWESYKWLKGEYFLECRWKILTLSGRDKDVNEGIMLIGNGKRQGDYTGRFFDSGGSTGLYELTVDEQHFNIANDRLRFRGTFNRLADVITGVWEALNENEVWEYWYDKKLRKVASRPL